MAFGVFDTRFIGSFGNAKRKGTMEMDLRPIFSSIE